MLCVAAITCTFALNSLESDWTASFRSTSRSFRCAAEICLDAVWAVRRSFSAAERGWQGCITGHPGLRVAQVDLLLVTIATEVMPLQLLSGPLGWLLGVAMPGAEGAFDELLPGWCSTVVEKVGAMSRNDAITWMADEDLVSPKVREDETGGGFKMDRRAGSSAGWP